MVTCGRLGYYKGWKLMIDAFKKFLTSYPDSVFYFSGGSFYETLQDCLKSEKVKKIIAECGDWDFCRYCSINCMYVASLIKHPYFMVRWIKDKLS